MYIDFISTLILENLKLFLKLLSSEKKKKKKSPKSKTFFSIQYSNFKYQQCHCWLTWPPQTVWYLLCTCTKINGWNP